MFVASHADAYYFCLCKCASPELERCSGREITYCVVWGCGGEGIVEMDDKVLVGRAEVDGVELREHNGEPDF